MENKQTPYHPQKNGIFWKSVSGIFGFLVGSTINHIAGFLNYQQYHDMKFQQKKHHKSLRGVMKAAPVNTQKRKFTLGFGRGLWSLE